MRGQLWLCDEFWHASHGAKGDRVLGLSSAQERCLRQAVALEALVELLLMLQIWTEHRACDSCSETISISIMFLDRKESQLPLSLDLVHA